MNYKVKAGSKQGCTIIKNDPRALTVLVSQCQVWAHKGYILGRLYWVNHQSIAKTTFLIQYQNQRYQMKGHPLIVPICP